ncbi:hypothetical protein GBAR_LOCUS11791 [Geodia barretti]|uniref:Uncharacterized protein n=1 Tax=Geodia barretti TaxID=519541 RepID=A0AA35RYM3_GEOBA|nr:hypothetical protein GBAR_LOCUS11791 [Geodia barretti]
MGRTYRSRRWYDTRVCDNIFNATPHASEREWRLSNLHCRLPGA